MITQKSDLQALHNTPDAVVAQESQVVRFLRKAAGLPSSNPQHNAPTNVAMLPNSGIAFPSTDPQLLQVPTGAKYVELKHKDFTLTLYVIDVAIEEDQIALLLTATARIDRMRTKAKFELVYDAKTYRIMYMGGNFTFTEPNPALRVLSFMRVADTIQKS